MPDLKYYYDRVPACGVFCGGCPMFTRKTKPCPGAGLNRQRCERCKTFHLCCEKRNITHCYQCKTFPCAKLKGFAKRWLKYGQDMIENQMHLKRHGKEEFIEFYNSKVSNI